MNLKEKQITLRTESVNIENVISLIICTNLFTFDIKWLLHLNIHVSCIHGTYIPNFIFSELSMAS